MHKILNVDPELAGQLVILEGRELKTDQARKIAAMIRRGKGDFRARLLMLGYYSKTQFRSKSAMRARSKHVLWMIENRPAHPVTAGGWCNLSFGQSSDHDAIRKARELWLNQIEKNQQDASILANAAWFFRGIHESQTAEALLIQAKQVEPHNAEWPRKLSSFFELERSFAPDGAKLELAHKALAEAELAFKLEKSKNRDFLAIQDLAWKAYKAGDRGRAEKYARTILDFAQRSSKELSDSVCVSLHHAYLVLGSLALDKADIQGAVDNLIASVIVPKPSPGNTLIPDMSLAKRLLEIGEHRAVLRYVEISAEICHDFRDERKKRHDWITALRTNQVPALERFIDYKHD